MEDYNYVANYFDYNRNIIVDIFFKVVLGLLCVAGFILLCIKFPWVFYVSVTIAIIYAILYAIRKFIADVIMPAVKNARDRKQNREWIKKNIGYYKYSKDQTDQLLYEYSKKYFKNVKNGYVVENMPWGRVNAFLSNFKKNIETDDALFFYPIQSQKFDDLREGGCVVTNYGIYYCYEDNDKWSTKYIPYYKMKQCGGGDNYVDFFSIRYDELTAYSKINIENIANSLRSFVRAVLSLKYNTVSPEEIVDETENINDLKDSIGTVIGNQGIAYTAKHSLDQWNSEQKNYLNSNRAGGYAAEYGNNTLDRLLGDEVYNAAQNLDEKGRQVKNGADRVVNGIEIQTKYYKSANESINAAFDQYTPRYIRNDGSGKMMQIEVPRDQYQEALRIMQEKIESGKIPNLDPQEDSMQYVRKGRLTYRQAQQVASAGTVEGIAIDGIHGVVMSMNGASISAAVTIACTYWKTQDQLASVEAGVKVGTNIMIKTAATQIIAGQLNRDRLAVPFTKSVLSNGQNAGSKTIHNSLSNIGKAAEEVTGVDAKVVNGAVATAVVAFGPDLIRNMQGKISTEQLLKNSVVTGSGLIAANAFYAVAGPVGSIIGSMATSFFVKNVLDNFIEDDVEKMFRILKLQFLDNVMASGLSDQEIKKVADQTMLSSDIDKILKNMYMSGNAEEYAETLVQQSVIYVMQQRPMVSNQVLMDMSHEIVDLIGQGENCI